MVKISSLARNIYRYSILALLLLLVLLVASHGEKSVSHFVLTMILILVIVILFEVLTTRCETIDINVENETSTSGVEGMNNISNIYGETFLMMNRPSISHEETTDNIMLPGNDVNFDVPFDQRGLVVKNKNTNVPEDIDYYKDDNDFIPNELSISGDKYDYLQRGYIYDDYPGDTTSEDNVILRPDFGQQGYFMENCNF